LKYPSMKEWGGKGFVVGVVLAETHFESVSLAPGEMGGAKKKCGS